MTCELMTARHHSEDTVEVSYGGPRPARLCGFHATYFEREGVAAARERDLVTMVAIDGMVGGTNGAVDNAKNIRVLRGLTGWERDYALDSIKAARRSWVVWHTLTQRKWQSNTRRLNRAIRQRAWWPNSRDTIVRAAQESVDTREKYVRCTP